MNCSHKVKGLRLCAGDGRVRFSNLNAYTHKHAHLHTHVHAVYTKQTRTTDTCSRRHTDTHPCHTHTHIHFLFLPLRWLVEAFIKKQAVSQQFMANSVHLHHQLLFLALPHCPVKYAIKSRRIFMPPRWRRLWPEALCFFGLFIRLPHSHECNMSGMP